MPDAAGGWLIFGQNGRSAADLDYLVYLHPWEWVKVHTIIRLLPSGSRRCPRSVGGGP